MANTLDNNDKTIIWNDVPSPPVSRATTIYDGNMVGVEDWYAGISLYDGSTVKRGAMLPTAATDKEGMVFGIDGIGVLAVSTDNKAYFISNDDYDNNEKTFTECTFNGDSFISGTIDNMFVDCGTITGVGRVLLLLEYKDTDNRKIWYSIANEDNPSVYANLGLEWNILDFSSTMSYFAATHIHGGQWLPNVGDNDGTLIIYTGDWDAGCAMLLCDDVEDLLNNPDTWFDRWGWGDSSTVAFTADVATDVITIASGNIANGTMVLVKSDDTLPSGLASYTSYYVIESNLTELKLCSTRGGSDAVNILTAGTGTHTIYITDRSTWDASPSEGGTPDSAYVVGWNHQHYRVVGGAWDAYTKKLYWIPDAPNTGSLPLKCVDLSSSSHTITDIVDADSGNIKGHGWTGTQTETGSVILTSSSALLSDGQFADGSDEYLHIYGITADGLKAKHLKKYKRGDSYLTKNRYPTVGAGSADEAVPSNLLSWNSGVYLGGWIEIAMHEDTSGLSDVRQGFSLVGGTVRTFRNLLEYGDFETWQRPDAVNITSIEDYSGTVAGTTKITVDTAWRVIDNRWITFSGTGFLDGTYQNKNINSTSFYVYVEYEDGGILGTVQDQASPSCFTAAATYSPESPFYARYTQSSTIPTYKSSHIGYSGSSFKYVVDAPSGISTTIKTYNHTFTETEMKYLRGKVVTFTYWVLFDGTFTEASEGSSVIRSEIYREAEAYAAGTSYNTGDKVAYGSFFARRIYRALKETIGAQPDISSDDWEDIGSQGWSTGNVMKRSSPNQTDVAKGMWLPALVVVDIPDDAASSDQSSYNCKFVLHPYSSSNVTSATSYIANMGVYEGIITEKDMYDLLKDHSMMHIATKGQNNVIDNF